jgi:hypothetical protein
VGQLTYEPADPARGIRIDDALLDVAGRVGGVRLGRGVHRVESLLITHDA